MPTRPEAASLAALLAAAAARSRPPSAPSTTTSPSCGATSRWSCSRTRDGARVAVVPAWQGRVMTSTVGGPSAREPRLDNDELVASGALRPHINAFGGEDRLWLGPEGGQFSIFFRKGDPFDLEHWQTPPLVDTEPVDGRVRRSARLVAFRHAGRLVNYSGTALDVPIDRTVRLLDAEAAAAAPRRRPAGRCPRRRLRVREHARRTPARGRVDAGERGALALDPRHVQALARDDDRRPVPRGARGRARPGRERRLLRQGPGGPARRPRRPPLLQRRRPHRSKIGLSPRRARPVLGSYDATRGAAHGRHVRPAGGRRRLRELDVGDPEGAVRGRRREQLQRRPARSGCEAPRARSTSSRRPRRRPPSPRATSLTHVHRTFHLEGGETDLDALARRVLGTCLAR